MKNILISTALLLCTLGLFAEETVVAEWDFSKEALTSGKYILLKRGKAAFVEDAERGKALAPCPVFENISTPAGLRLKQLAPELTATTGFEWQCSVKWKMPEQAPEKGFSMILADSAYASKTGAQLLLFITPKKECQLRLVVGTGEKFETSTNDAGFLADGKWHDISVRYEDGDFAIKVDNNLLQLFTPTKPMAASNKVYFSIGDRSAASYVPFLGLIGKFKVIAIQ